LESAEKREIEAIFSRARPEKVSVDAFARRRAARQGESRVCRFRTSDDNS
jgi:hypothetical protein